MKVALVSLDAVTFRNNSNPGLIGGAVSLTQVDRVLITRCKFIGNVAAQAGALYIWQGAAASLEQTLFQTNRAQGEMLESLTGGLVEGVVGKIRQYGASAVFNAVQNVSLLENKFSGNKVSRDTPAGARATAVHCRQYTVMLAKQPE
jgi:hypothetical protein